MTGSTPPRPGQGDRAERHGLVAGLARTGSQLVSSASVDHSVRADAEPLGAGAATIRPVQ
jgi:hypothetical protein